MAKASPQPTAASLRKETQKWLATRTIPTMREIAKDLENAGEDVRDLLRSIDELEALVKTPPRTAQQSTKAKA